MTQNIEQAKKIFHLSSEQIDGMKKTAAEFINKYIQENNKKYAPVAIWLYNLVSVQKEEIILDPDKLILTALFKDNTLEPHIKNHFSSSIKKAFHVSDQWISDKITDNLMLEVEPNEKSNSTVKSI